MSGPIVRSGPSEKFSGNWAQAFGAKSDKATAAKASKKKTAKKKKKKS